MANELQRRDDAQLAIQKPLFALLQKRKKDIEAIIPHFLTPERVFKLVNLAIVKTPDLVNCSPHSVVNAIMHASMLGLEIAPEQSYLVPFKDKKGRLQATLMIDYRGKRDIVVSGGLVKNIHPYVVFSKDEFSMELDPSLGLMQVRYKPFVARKTEEGLLPIEDEKQRGVPLGVLSIAPFASGGADVLFMPMVEINAVRARSRSGESGPWKTDFLEMAKKTAVHRHCKSLPKPKNVEVWRPGQPLPVAERIARSQQIDDQFELAEPLEDVIEADFEDEQPMIPAGSVEAQEKVAERKIEELKGHGHPAGELTPEENRALDEKLAREEQEAGRKAIQDELQTQWPPYQHEPARSAPKFGRQK